MKAFAPVKWRQRFHELKPFTHSDSFYLRPLVVPEVVYIRVDTVATEEQDLQRLARARLKFSRK